MPTAVETRVRAYAHCINPMCPGYGQEEVPAVSTETSYTFRDHGGDSREVFRSFVELRFGVDADEADRDVYVEEYREAAACRSCSRPRELSATPRPSYMPLSGHDPYGLINGTVAGFNPQVTNTQADAEMAELKAANTRLEAKMEELLSKLGGA